MDNSRSFFRKISRIATGAGVAAFIGSMLVIPLVARAELPTPEEALIPIPIPPGTMVVYDIRADLKEKVGGILSTLVLAGITTLMNAATVFFQRIAYDTAQSILTGDAGKSPLFYEDGFGAYLENVGNDVADQFVSDLDATFFEPFGLSLCKPLDPLQLQLSISGVGKIEFLKAKCTVAQVGKAFEQTKEAFNTSKEAFDNIVPTLSSDTSDLAIGFKVHQAQWAQGAKAKEQAIFERGEGGGMKAVRDIISGKIITPAEKIKQGMANGDIMRMNIEQNQYTYAALYANAFRVGATQLALLTASTFVNTLVTGLMEKAFKGMKDSSVNVADVDLVNVEAISNRNVANARIVYSDLLTPNLISRDQQDFVVELSACANPRGLWGCSMDDAFAAALRTTGENGGHTVARAAHINLNGLPPSNPAFLHKDWQLIPESEAKDNTDPTCYQRAYCASNLAKLRYARILPVGWEMAANSPYNVKKNGKYVTLGEAIRGFNTCNDKGEVDAQHPWCHLVDPNWVLTAPPFQCRVKGFGETVYSGTGMRMQECADAVSCLQRDNRGNCVGGYGYCVAEKATWRFGGDACPAQFASCRTYKNGSGELVSYLRNTIDYGACSKENKGCLWYATERDSKDPSGATWVGDISNGPRVYLDGTVKSCSSANDGCTRLMSVVPGQPALNLIKNGSFERSPEGKADELISWKLPGPYKAPDNIDENIAVDGNRSYFAPNQQSTLSQEFALAPLRNYVFSASVRALDGTKPALYKLYVRFKDSAGGDMPVNGPKYYRSAGCVLKDINEVGFKGALPAANATQWTRLQCSFVTDANVAFGQIGFEDVGSKGSNVLIDALQVEEGEVAMAFVDGLADNLKDAHLKLPPEELACKGKKDDAVACGSYARMCDQGDAGCQGYRETNNPTAPEIPASLSASDFCPSVCAGYAEYRKLPSAFDLSQNVDERLDDPEDDIAASFVPTYAKSCRLQDVGCEAFTNVEAAAAGGESTSYFNYLRACEKPGDDSETYFTWEGSDKTGYQLRTWSLMHDKSEAPNPLPPKIIAKAGISGLLKEPTACNAVSWAKGIDADCRQLFNANGDAFYAFYSQTIISSPDCRDYRKSNTNVADCSKTGGSFQPVTKDCIYKALAAESRSCGADFAGCRAYIGTTGHNATEVYVENFKDSSKLLQFTGGGAFSNESVLVGDQSLKITSGGASTFFQASPGQLYRVSFWAKATTPGTQSGVFVSQVPVGTIKITPEWGRFEVGPFTAEGNPLAEIAWTDLPNATFLDEIRIEQLNDVSYVVKNSWSIPAICDRTPEGLPEPQAMLGCRNYYDRNKTTVNVRRFGQLCREEAIGCKAFVDTRNSDDPYGETFVLTGTDVNTKQPNTPAFKYNAAYVGNAGVTRAADRYIYAIDEARARCDASQASCRAFGKPKFKQDQLSLADGESAFQTVYLMDDVKQYMGSNGEPSMLCRKDELFCDEFTSGKTVAWFRNPQNHTCVWRDKVDLKKDAAKGIPADAQYSGWFRSGLNEPCYYGAIASGNTFRIENGGDNSYAGWVGMCPSEQSECTEFRDPNDHSDPAYPSGKQYFFIKNQRLDLSSCGGTVDRMNGCVLFRDMSSSQMTYSSFATYAKANATADAPLPPIDCTNDPNNPYCQTSKVCGEMKVDDCKGAGCKRFDDIGFYECVTDPACNGPKKGTEYCTKVEQYCTGPQAVEKIKGQSCNTDVDCALSVVGEVSDAGPQGYSVSGTCKSQNDSNAVMKVRLDRDCAKWLGCATSETVYDPAQQKYVDLCTDVALCSQSSGANAGSFCAQYADRSKEQVLKAGTFFDNAAYTKRSVGFGELDYSGYTIPDQFQAADIKNLRVGYEIFDKLPQIQSKFSLDYRLSAVVPGSSGLLEFPQDDVSMDALYPNLRLCRHKQTGRIGFYKSGTLSQKDRICYFAIDALSTRTSEVANGNAQTSDPRNVQQLSDIFRQSTDSKNNVTLQRSFPPAECKAYPETDAPFSNLFVKEWNMLTGGKPKAQVIAEGYEGVKLCEFGEDCACSYRKVKYDNAVKYFSPFGLPPPDGICRGGNKDGQPCVPSKTKTDNAELSNTEDPGCPAGGRCIEATGVVLVRGQYGQCLQRDMSRSIAADLGRHPCMVWNPTPILASNYDTYHFVPTAGYTPPVNAGEYYCLSFAKPPIESVWSTESHTNWKDSTQRDGDGGNQFFYLPGSLSKFNYDRGYIAGKCHSSADICGDINEDACNCLDGVTEFDGGKKWDYAESMRKAAGQAEGTEDDPRKTIEDEVGYGDAKTDPIDDDANLVWKFQGFGSGIDGSKPIADKADTSWQADWCSTAASFIPEDGDVDGSDSYPGYGGKPGSGIGPFENAPDAYYDRGRWIQTGRGLGRTYMEYFFPVKPKGIAKWLYPNLTDAQLASQASPALNIENFSQFQFFLQNDEYLSACGMPYWYVDGVSKADFTNAKDVKDKSNAIYSAFVKEFDGNLDRSKEAILRDKDGQPKKLKCTGLEGVKPDYASSADGQCYYKYWETNYRLNGAQPFRAADAPGQMDSDTSLFDWSKGYYSSERTCEKTGFGIRAMFENADKPQNDKSPEDVSKNTESQLAGPWKFVGFWITACSANTNLEQFAYLSLRVKSADVCRELAQVVSPFTRESAAFADRVWNKGSFILPKLGFDHGTQFQPFGSALATGIPGKEPLFQTNGPVENFSPLKPPTFTGSGPSYYVSGAAKPRYTWSYLLNIFARIYRIYKYEDTVVTRNDMVCMQGPNKGKLCTPDNAVAVCGTVGKCNPGLASDDLKKTTYKCNGLSGVNSGLDCGGEYQIRSWDPVCHNAAMKNIGGSLTPQLGRCELRNDKLYGYVNKDADRNVWVKSTDVDGYFTKIKGWTVSGSSKLELNKAYSVDEAKKLNAFACANGTVLPGMGCSAPEEYSKDCPLEVKNVPCIKDDFGQMAGHCGNGFEHARCSDNVQAVKADTDLTSLPSSAECVFTAAQWWGAYDDGIAKTGVAMNDDNATGLTALDVGVDGGDKFGHKAAYACPRNGGGCSADPRVLPFRLGWDAECDAGAKYCGAVTGKIWSMSDMSRGFGDMSVVHRYNWTEAYAWSIRYGAITHVASTEYTNSDAFQQRWPAPHTFVAPLGQETVGYYLVPGMCEGPIGTSQDPDGLQGEIGGIASKSKIWGRNADGSGGYQGRQKYALTVGICEGGQFSGQQCFNDPTIIASDLWPHPNDCAFGEAVKNQPADVATWCKAVVTQITDNGFGEQTPSSECKGQGDSFSPDPDLDNNSCTHGAGYVPRKDICGDSSSEKCLTGYIPGNQKSLDEGESQTPTDVTSGWHIPTFLGLENANPDEFRHIAFYAPRPPVVAAPDLSRTCSAPGVCPISAVGAFAVESQTSGPISFAGGKAQIAVRFYGWAAHDQTPLKYVNVDWGDGKMTSIEQAKLRNKKPFCSVTSECELIPGLTCSSDADCPPGGGRCASRGTCQQNSSRTCSTDNDCQAGGKKGDKCVIREFFGNSREACEQNYFEFTHAYGCNPAILSSCQTAMGVEMLRCNRNPDIVCSDDSGAVIDADGVAGPDKCGAGDTCVAGLAPSSGCFDGKQVMCRFTPKVMLKDSWNWCTGECRSEVAKIGELKDGANAKVRHLYGGCWDGTETKKNTNIDQSIMDKDAKDAQNECEISVFNDKANANVIKQIRPWIVYQGAVQIGLPQ